MEVTGNDAQIIKGCHTLIPELLEVNLKKCEAANSSVPKPLLYRIIVELDPINRFAGDSKLIEKTPAQIDREELSRCRGRIVAKGPYAFERHPNGQPEIGDFILFCQFAGDFVKDAATGKDYRVIDDLEVKAIIPETADRAGQVGL